jgi:hypothetical protein
MLSGSEASLILTLYEQAIPPARSCHAERSEASLLSHLDQVVASDAERSEA